MLIALSAGPRWSKASMRAKYADTSSFDVIVPAASAACNCGIVASRNSNVLVCAFALSTQLPQRKRLMQGRAHARRIRTFKRAFMTYRSVVGTAYLKAEIATRPF